MNWRPSPSPQEPQRPRVTHAVLLKNNRRRPQQDAPKPVEPIDSRAPVAPLSKRQRLARAGRVFSLLFFFVPLVLGFCYLVSMRLQVVRAGIELAQVSRQQDKLLQENRELRVEKASLRSPAKIAEQAQKDFQMSIPEPQRVIVLDHEGTAIPELKPLPEVQESFGGHAIE